MCQPTKSKCVSKAELYLPDEVHILPNRRGPEYSILAEYEHQRSSIHDANLQKMHFVKKKNLPLGVRCLKGGLQFYFFSQFLVE